MPNNLITDAVRDYHARQNLKARAHFTPDFKDLDKYSEILVFVWGNDKYGFFNHHVALSGAKYLGRGITLEDDYIMKRNQNFPFVSQDIKKKNNVQHAKIVGEIYQVTPMMMTRLDQLWNNNGDVMRESKYICCRDQVPPTKDKSRPPIVQMWMYLYDPDIFKEKTKSLALGVNLRTEDQDWAFNWTSKKLYPDA